LSLIKQIDEGTINRNIAQHKVEEFWMGALRKAAIDGDVDYGSLMAGQSVGLINKSESCDEIMHDLVSGIDAEVKRTKELLK